MYFETYTASYVFYTSNCQRVMNNTFTGVNTEKNTNTIYLMPMNQLFLRIYTHTYNSVSNAVA